MQKKKEKVDDLWKETCEELELRLEKDDFIELVNLILDKNYTEEDIDWKRAYETQKPQKKRKTPKEE